MFTESSGPSPQDLTPEVPSYQAPKDDSSKKTSPPDAPVIPTLFPKPPSIEEPDILTRIHISKSSPPSQAQTGQHGLPSASLTTTQLPFPSPPPSQPFPQSPSISGDTALIIAISQNQGYAIETLIDAGANVNAQDQNGQTALMHAIMIRDRPGSNLEATVKLLIKAGANVNMRDRFGDTALMQAVLCHRGAFVKLLVDAGANLDARNRDGETALMLAVRVNAEECITFLVAAGADLYARNQDGQTALMIAAAEGVDRKNIYDFLVNATRFTWLH